MSFATKRGPVGEHEEDTQVAKKGHTEGKVSKFARQRQAAPQKKHVGIILEPNIKTLEWKRAWRVTAIHPAQEPDAFYTQEEPGDPGIELVQPGRSAHTASPLQNAQKAT